MEGIKRKLVYLAWCCIILTVIFWMISTRGIDDENISKTENHLSEKKEMKLNKNRKRRTLKPINLKDVFCKRT